MASDSQGAVVAYGSTIYRYDASFGGEVSFATVATPILGLFLDGNLVVALHSADGRSKVSTFDRTTGALISSPSFSESIFKGASQAPGMHYLFGRTTGVFPSDIMLAIYTADGTVKNIAQSPYHFVYPDATKTWVFPGEEWVVDSSGNVYTTTALTHVGDFGGAFTDIDFAGDVPVVLRGNQLYSYTPGLIQTGSTPISSVTGAKIYVESGNVFVFSPGDATPGALVVSLALTGAQASGTPANPAGIAYNIDSAFQDKNGTLLLLSSGQKSVFRWSPATRSYGKTIPLAKVANFGAYSAENDSLYLAGETNVVRAVNVSQEPPSQSVFAILTNPPLAVATAGPAVLAALYPNQNFVFSSDGTQTDQRNLSDNFYYQYPGKRPWEWDPAKQHLYYFAGGTDQNLAFETVNAAGKISSFGMAAASESYGLAGPIRISKDGLRAALGSSRVYNTTTMSLQGALESIFLDAIWTDTNLTTIRAVANATEVGTWDPVSLAAGAVKKQLLGTPFRIFKTQEGFVVITSVSGIPRFYLLNDALDTLYVSPSPPPTPTGLAVTSRASNSIALQWTDASDTEEGFRVEYQSGNSAWTTGATVGANQTSTTVPGLGAGRVYQFRVTAFNSAFQSSPSASVSGTTLPSSDFPLGEPYNLKVTRIYQNRIALSWTDNASNESGFVLYRSSAASDLGTAIPVGANATSFEDTGLTPNVPYYYRIQVVNGGIQGDLSAAVLARTLSADTVPGAPSTLAAASPSAGVVDLIWVDSSLNEDNFLIERSTASNGDWSPLATLSFNAVKYRDATAIPGSTYSYRVRAVNAIGSSVSNVASIKVVAAGGDYAGYSMRWRDVYYFAFTGPNRVERYDLANRVWLTPVALDAVACALWVDDYGIFVGEARKAYRYALDGSGGSQIGALTPTSGTQYNIGMMFTLNGLLCFGSVNSDFVTYNVQTGTLVSTFSRPGIGSGPVTVPAQSKVYYRTINTGPASIQSITLSASGVASQISYSPGAFDGLPDATHTFLFPDGSRIADDSGTVYTAGTMAYDGSMGGSFTDMTFTSSGTPLVLRGDSLEIYNDSYFSIGSYKVGPGGQAVAVNGTDALAFLTDGTSTHGFSVQIVPVANLVPPVTGPPVDPRGLAFVPDNVIVDRDGVVNLVSKAQKSVFRWSPATGRYLPTLPLRDVPDFSGYSATQNRLFFANATHRTLQTMDLSDSDPVEKDFINLNSTPIGFTMAGEYPYVALTKQAATFTPQGTMISTPVSAVNYAKRYVWDPMLRRVYHFSDYTTSGQFYYETISDSGQITDSQNSFILLNAAPVDPIIVSPDGRRIAEGHGNICSASAGSNLQQLGAISSGSLVDGLFLDLKFLTLHASGSQTVIRMWNRDTAASLGSVPGTFAGSPLRILALPGGRALLVTNDRGMPHYFVLQADLSVLYDYIPDAPQFNSAPTANATEDVAYSWTPDAWVSPLAQPATLTARNLPSWLHIVDGVLSGTPREADSGDRLSPTKVYQFTLVLQDAAGRVSELPATVSVHWVNDSPVFIGGDEPVVNLKGQNFQVDASAWLQDPDGNDTHQWKITGNSNPALFSSISISQTGLLSIQFANYVSGSSQVTLEVTDAGGRKGRKTITITLPDLRAPFTGPTSAITQNAATGLYEQVVVVTNASPRAIAGFDLKVEGVGAGILLFNGMAGADGIFNLAYHQPLQPGASVALTLQYYLPPGADVPQPVFSASLASPDSPLVLARGFTVDRMLRQADGSVLLEFPAGPGKNYQFEYSDDAVTWKVSPYPVRAAGTRVQWIDHGPPWTDSQPADAWNRFYRVRSLDN